jgi:hypothetical protein
VNVAAKESDCGRDRAYGTSDPFIARSDPSSNASDPRIAPDGSQSRVQIVSPTCPLRWDREVRFAEQAIASPDRTFGSTGPTSRSTLRNSLQRRCSGTIVSTRGTIVGLRETIIVQRCTVIVSRGFLVHAVEICASLPPQSE